MTNTRRVRVTWTVEYETGYQPADEDAVDGAVERLMELVPQDVLMSDGSELVAVGWSVEHPEWGDMRMGSLQMGRGQ